MLTLISVQELSFLFSVFKVKVHSVLKQNEVKLG